MSESIIDLIKKASVEAKAQFEADMLAKEAATRVREQKFESDLRMALATKGYPQKINIRGLHPNVFAPVKVELEQHGFVATLEHDTDGPVTCYEKLIIHGWRPLKTTPQ